VAFNTAGSSGSGKGGGLYIGSEVTLTVRNSLIAANGDFNGPAFANDCAGPVRTLGYNLIGDGTLCTGITNGVNGDRVGTALNPIDARLGPLQDNGGPTQTDALLAGSPAINAANPLGCLDAEGNLLPTDQRGFPRVGRCDIGAFEFVLARVLLPLIER
jgi:hypothetical protein